MEQITVNTKPIQGQKPGTSGLRKKTRTFMEPHFLENYVQSIFDGIGGIEGRASSSAATGAISTTAQVR